MRKLQIGDRVRVLGKTYGHSIINTKFKKGDIAEISWVGTSSCQLKGDTISYWNPEDLEYIGGSMEKAKYKGTSNDKGPTAFNFYKDGDINCREFAENFKSLLMELQPKNLDTHMHIDDVIVWANQDSKRTKWLLEKGFIEEVQSAYDKWVGDMPELIKKDSGIRINVGPKSKEKLLDWAKRMPR